MFLGPFTLCRSLFLVIVFQELDESGAEIFTLLLPSGTPLPARRHCVLSGDGKLSSVCMNIYQKLLMEQPQQLAKVQITQRCPPKTPHQTCCSRKWAALVFVGGAVESVPCSPQAGTAVVMTCVMTCCYCERANLPLH